MKEFTTAVEEVAAEDESSEETPIPFKIDGREMKAYKPNDGQITFMLAAMGRGQSNESRFASIVNLMLECLEEEDRIYLESRLLTRDKKNRIPMKVVESVFEYLTEEWFGRPTQPQSDSVSSPASDGQN